MTTEPVALTVHFDSWGNVLSAEYPDGRTISNPLPSLQEEPLQNINLRAVKAYDVLVWEESGTEGELTRRIALCWFCRRYMDLHETPSQG